MLKLFKNIALIVLFNCVLIAQNGWIWQNPLPHGNDISNLQFLNTTTAYALCFNSIIKTTNAGNNWSIYYTNHSQNNASLQFINETTGFIVSDSGLVLKSVNGGVNWNTVYDFRQSGFHKIYFNDVNTGYLLKYNNYYSGYGTLLYRSTNSGISWNLLFNDTTITINDIKFTGNLNGYFAGFFGVLGNNFRYAKIFKTINGGLSIDSLNTGFNMLITGLEIKNNTLFIYGSTGIPFVSGFFLSTNSGLNWIPSDLHKNIKDIAYIEPGNLFATTPSGGGFAYLYKSTNNGANWSNIGSDLKCYDIEFINTTSGISAGSNGGVYRTTNSGVNWIRTTTTFLDNYFWSVEFVNSTTGFAGGGNTLFKTTNGGNNWFLIPRIPGEQIEFTDENTGYTTNVDTMYKTTNCGLNWINLNYGLPGQINEISFINNNTGFFIGKYNILKKTIDGGNSWSQLSGYGGGYQECMYFYNESLGFIGREDYNLGWGISRTTNGGLNWDFQTLPSVTDYIYDFNFVNSSTGFFTTTGKIFKTTNSGNNWYQVYEFTNSFGYWSALWSIQFLNETIGYATASEGKVLKTTDGGETWKVFQSITNYGFFNLSFTDINTGYLVGWGGVILKTTNGCGDPISIQQISNLVPDKYILKQNYPNPFNPVTTIGFSIPNTQKNEQVRLIIYDVLGRKITELMDEILKPGEYEISWNAENFSSGVYFYSLKTGNNIINRKMILLK